MNAEFGIAMAFVTGVFGAWHCIGMCSGVNAGFFAGIRRAPRALDLVLFHATRIGVYALLGIAGALLGQVVAQSGIVGKLQGILMMLAGVLVVVLGMNLVRRRVGAPAEPVTSPVVPLASLATPARPYLAPLFGGVLNGLVPCSLVFSVAVPAAATADPLQAGLLMLAFGAGTLPVLAAMSLLGASLGCRVRGVMARLAGITVAALGIWTFYQGYVMYEVFAGLANW